MIELPDLPAGIYRHYKGPLYLVLGYAHDANADEFLLDDTAGSLHRHTVPFGERNVVVYVGLQLDAAHTGPRLAVRTAADFHAWVHPDGSLCRTGAGSTNSYCFCRPEPLSVGRIRRFTYLGPTWEGD